MHLDLRTFLNDHLQISLSTAKRLIANGELPGAYQLGGKWLVDVKRWEQENIWRTQGTGGIPADMRTRTDRRGWPDNLHVTNGIYWMHVPRALRKRYGRTSISLQTKDRLEAFRMARELNAKFRDDLADVKARRVLSQLDRSPTFTDYCTEWRGRVLPTATKKTGSPMGPKTRSDYERMLRRQIEPSPLLDKPLTELSAQDIRQFLAPWMNTKPKYYNYLLTVLQRVLRDAVDEGHIKANPSREVVRRGTERPTQYMSDAEYVAITSGLPEWMRRACDLMYLTTARPGTVLSLREDQITTADGKVLLEFVAAKNGQEMRLWSEEDSDLGRTVEWFRGWKRSHEIVAPTLICYPTTSRSSGQPVTVEYISRAFGNRARELGMKYTLRDIRPKGFSDHVRDGGDKAILGDRSPAMAARYNRLPMTAESKLRVLG